MKARRLPEAFEPNSRHYYVPRPAPLPVGRDRLAESVVEALCLCDEPACPGRQFGERVTSSHDHAHLYPAGFANRGVCPHSVYPRLSGFDRVRVREARIQHAEHSKVGTEYIRIELALLERGL
ncbi:hypothetical protein [Xanthomonas sp. NCPPB 2632]|uniref:hypothetical protein n=1 Tax=Xanthomonas sp. NCPPB 2632 TaxID=3240912 RepID=UPI003512FC46